MERMIGSIGWWLAVAAVLDLGGLSGGMRAWWRTLIGSTLLQGVVLVLGVVVAAPSWLTLCIAHMCGAIVLAVQLLRHQQRVRGATGWKNAMQLTWQLLRTNSRQLWASLPQRRRRAWTWWQGTGQYLLPWQQWLVWSVLLVTGIAALAPESSSVPSASMAARLADVTRALGGPLLMVLVIVETILVAAGLVRVTDFMFRTMKRIAVFTWLLAIVAHVGPAFEDVAQQSPTDAALLAGALVLVVSVVRQVPIQLQPAASGRTATAPGVDSVGPGIPYRQPAVDRETCAIHEAGHALLYATPLPWHPDVTAVVHAVPHHGRGGYVTAPFWDQMDMNVTMTEWHMLAQTQQFCGSPQSTVLWLCYQLKCTSSPLHCAREITDVLHRRALLCSKTTEKSVNCTQFLLIVAKIYFTKGDWVKITGYFAAHRRNVGSGPCCCVYLVKQQNTRCLAPHAWAAVMITNAGTR